MCMLVGGCVALGTSTSSGAGGPWYNYQGGISQARPVATSGPLSICPFFFVCVCTCTETDS